MKSFKNVYNMKVKIKVYNMIFDIKINKLKRYIISMFISNRHFIYIL